MIDTATQIICGWLAHDPDNFYFAQKLVHEWQDEGAEPLDVLSDLASYLCETLDSADGHTLAGKSRDRLSGAYSESVDWQAVLDKLTEE